MTVVPIGVVGLVVIMASGFYLAAEAEEVWPGAIWGEAAPEEMGMDSGKLCQARDYALEGGGSGYILRDGKLVFKWGDTSKRYDLKSTTKSFGATALGIALKDGKIKSLDDKANEYHPSLGMPPESNRETGRLEEITIFHLATHTAGFDKDGGYTQLLFEPGTKWSYSDGGPNWLAECLTLAYRQDLKELMFERVFTPLGIKESDLSWRKNAYRRDLIEGIKRREFGSGISANVDAMARIGYLYLKKGKWAGKEIIPQRFVEGAATTLPAVKGLPIVRPEKYFNASDHYGLLWWNNADGTMPRVPRDAYWSWGLYESLILVVPSLDIVAARAGGSWHKKWTGAYKVLEPFFEPIVASLKETEAMSGAPYPPSPVIAGITWAPVSTIIRKGEGSDNWPVTWADDDSLYTAYGDGWGFAPRVPQKLSLGLARVTGMADNFKGTNIRSPGAEQKGDGRSGKKASGMLIVEGVLYMLVRNAGNSQLAWSKDQGKTWTWCDWKFTTSFGCPTFLNFGKNYAGARDQYVYVFSPDSDTAYEPADRMVLARVPRDNIIHRQSYEFFKELDASGNPVWTEDIGERGAVFTHPGRCYRSGISYNAPLRRYLWCQTIPGGDTRFKGGMGIYDAPDPWGPWSTVFFTESWDVGPGESSSFPTKWMSGDGKTLHLLFSGEDCFSVRKATLMLGPGN